jgi:hypothetical protein
MRVRLPHLPLKALVVKRTSPLASNEKFRVRIPAGELLETRNAERGTSICKTMFFVPRSAFRAGKGPVVQWYGRLPDTEKIGGSTPPGIMRSGEW